MKTIKIPYILFSLAVIAALTLACAPAPAYALAAGGQNSYAVTLQASVQTSTPALIPPYHWVCRKILVHWNGHLVLLRRCHRVLRPSA